MRITIYRTDDGYSLQPQLGSERLEMELAEDVQVREGPLLHTLRVYREATAHSLNTALALGWLKPVTYTVEEEATAEHPYRSLLYTMMGIRPTANA